MTTTSEELDDRDNNILAAGGIFAALLMQGLDVDLIAESGLATNQLRVKIPFLKSPYRITVERVLEETDEAEH